VSSIVPHASNGGHHCGGPFVYLLAVTVLAGACAPATSPTGASPRRAEPVPRPADVYQRLGLVSGPPSFPVVGGYTTLAGAGDSTLVLLSLSLPNSALRFQRSERGFVAEYVVEAAFVRDGIETARLQHRETVRVASFAETARIDESVVFQSTVTLAPGSYEVRLRASDGNSSRGMRATDTLSVPAYGASAARVSPPVIVYEAGGRHDRAAPPALIANPRRTAAFGGDAPRIYLEAYAGETPVRLYLRSEAGAVVWEHDFVFGENGSALRHALIDVPADALPLGRYTIDVVTADGAVSSSPLVLTISDQWLAGNFDELLQILAYIATPQELDSLATGTPADRRQRWDSFWARRDPLPATPGNEFRDEFFQRIRHAAENFGEVGRPGWQTDRGEVFVVLGPPDFVRERRTGRTDLGLETTGIEWVYERSPGGRLQLLFIERIGLTRLELVPASRAAFRAVAERLKSRPLRD
jgi:GWxTD domain-containing protein